MEERVMESVYKGENMSIKIEEKENNFVVRIDRKEREWKKGEEVEERLKEED